MDNQENEIIKQGNVTNQGSLEQKHLMEDGVLGEIENLTGQLNLFKVGNLDGEENVIEEEIVVEEELIIEDVLEEDEIKTESNRSQQSKRSSKVSKVALSYYTQIFCTYNEVCSNFGISKKEFKKQLLAYEEYKNSEEISERDWESYEASTDLRIKKEKDTNSIEPRQIFAQIRKKSHVTSSNRR